MTERERKGETPLIRIVVARNGATAPPAASSRHEDANNARASENILMYCEEYMSSKNKFVIFEIKNLEIFHLCNKM